MRSHIKLLAFAFFLVGQISSAQTANTLKVLYLGDNGHHQPAVRFSQLQPILEGRGIRMKYTDNMQDLNSENLAEFDALVVYANIDRIEASEENALLDYVAKGGGFVPLHCATYCFRNSDEVVQLMGAQFKRHGGEVFRTEIAITDHVITKGFGGFESWDETYVHHLHNEKNRTVLEYRVDKEGREPWTWTRTHGEGRVFYTAWGHDHRTWRNPGFHNLVERGIRWAAKDDPSVVPSYLNDLPFETPEMTPKRTDKKPFDYIDVGAKIPNYPPSSKWGVQEEPLTKMQKPLSPEESIKHFVTPVDFEVKLYAAEPDLGGKPIAMNWDEQGRLWVCESYDYPNELQPGNKGRDRIRICEDTDRDGKADKFTVFAEELSIPTAITFYRGGAIVHNGTETLYLKDTNGDGKADVRKILVSDWALGDTHGGVSNFRYGHDNWFWAMQGYNNSSPKIAGKEQTDAERQSFRMGFFRFKLDNNDPPNVTDIEFIRSTNNNTWGLGLTEEGLVTGSTANRNPSVYMPLANRYYERVRGWGPTQLGTMADNHLFEPVTDRVRQVDQHGGYTAGAGHAVYTARAYPKQYWNRTAFVCGPTGHLVGTFVMKRDGADVSSYSPSNLLASTDEWSAPIAAEVGPDGNVWALDWYNYIVQHNPTPRGFERGNGNAYATDLRDKKYGRIYRVAYNGNKEAQTWTSLQNATPSQLIDALSHPTMTWRLHAQRLLVERGQLDVVPALMKKAMDESVDEIGQNPGVIHALCTLQGLGALKPNDSQTQNLAELVFKHSSPGVRRIALLTIPLDEILISNYLTNLALDSDYQVRLAALRAIADTPAPSSSAGAVVIASAVDKSSMADRWLKDAIMSAGSVHAGESWQFDFDGAVPIEFIERMAEHAARGKMDGGSLSNVLASLAKMSPTSISAAIRGLSAGWPKDHKVDIGSAGEENLKNALKVAGPNEKGQLVQLAATFGSKNIKELSKEIASTLENAIADATINDAKRIDAATQLAGILPVDSVKTILNHIGPQSSPELASGLLNALANASDEAIGPALVEKAISVTPKAREVALNVLLKRPKSTMALLEGIEQRQLQIPDLKLDQRQALSNHPNNDIKQRWTKLLKASGGLPDPDRQKVIEDMIAITHVKGDVKKGLAVFEKQCSKCHMHGKIGQQIGPNLTGMSVHPKEELLVHILDPSRSVEGNFRQYTVVKSDGQVINGMLASESKTAVEIIDTEAKRHAIARSDIDELIGSKKSVMPEGFEKLIAKAEFTDLLEFLTDKGKFVPLPLDKVATVVSTKGMFHGGDNGADRIVFDEWGGKSFKDIPFYIVDPKGKSTLNMILLNGPQGTLPPKMPKQIELAANMPIKTLHMLGGIGGWSYPAVQNKSTSVIVRFRYADGETEDHELKNGVHFADYIRRVDVPESEFAFQVRGQQVRYLSVSPKRTEVVEQILLVKGDDATAPIVVAVTLETP